MKAFEIKDIPLTRTKPHRLKVMFEGLQSKFYSTSQFDTNNPKCVQLQAVERFIDENKISIDLTTQKALVGQLPNLDYVVLFTREPNLPLIAIPTIDENTLINYHPFYKHLEAMPQDGETIKYFVESFKDWAKQYGFIDKSQTRVNSSAIKQARLIHNHFWFVRFNNVAQYF